MNEVPAPKKREECPACGGFFPIWWDKAYKHQGDRIIDCWHGPSRSAIPPQQAAG